MENIEKFLNDDPTVDRQEFLDEVALVLNDDEKKKKLR
mgnify:CR=1 FL=1